MGELKSAGYLLELLYKIEKYEKVGYCHDSGIEMDSIYRKKLLYISTHRGTKEGDLIIGGFAREYLFIMTPEKVESFSHLLTYPDAVIMEWVRSPQTIPEEIDRELIQSIKTYLVDSLAASSNSKK